jgi:hypothetical protein
MDRGANPAVAVKITRAQLVSRTNFSDSHKVKEGKRPLGRPRHRWVDNIRMDLGEVGWGDVDWIGLSRDRNRWRALVNSVLNLRVP